RALRAERVISKRMVVIRSGSNVYEITIRASCQALRLLREHHPLRIYVMPRPGCPRSGGGVFLRGRRTYRDVLPLFGKPCLPPTTSPNAPPRWLVGPIGFARPPKTENPPLHEGNHIRI